MRGDSRPRMSLRLPRMNEYRAPAAGPLFVYSWPIRGRTSTPPPNPPRRVSCASEEFIPSNASLLPAAVGQVLGAAPAEVEALWRKMEEEE
jgi:hypothetical protein